MKKKQHWKDPVVSELVSNTLDCHGSSTSNRTPKFANATHTQRYNLPKGELKSPSLNSLVKALKEVSIKLDFVNTCSSSPTSSKSSCNQRNGKSHLAKTCDCSSDVHSDHSSRTTSPQFYSDLYENKQFTRKDRKAKIKRSALRGTQRSKSNKASSTNKYAVKQKKNIRVKPVDTGSSSHYTPYSSKGSHSGFSECSGGFSSDYDSCTVATKKRKAYIDKKNVVKISGLKNFKKAEIERIKKKYEKGTIAHAHLTSEMIKKRAADSTNTRNVENLLSKIDGFLNEAKRTPPFAKDRDTGTSDPFSDNYDRSDDNESYRSDLYSSYSPRHYTSSGYPSSKESIHMLKNRGRKLAQIANGDGLDYMFEFEYDEYGKPTNTAALEADADLRDERMRRQMVEFERRKEALYKREKMRNLYKASIIEKFGTLDLNLPKCSGDCCSKVLSFK